MRVGATRTGAHRFFSIERRDDFLGGGGAFWGPRWLRASGNRMIIAGFVESSFTQFGGNPPYIMNRTDVTGLTPVLGARSQFTSIPR